jgi:hypothetical protein
MAISFLLVLCGSVLAGPRGVRQLILARKVLNIKALVGLKLNLRLG